MTLPSFGQSPAPTTQAPRTSMPQASFLPEFLSPTSRYRLLWNLFGREVLAAILALLEIGLLIWSGLTQKRLANQLMDANEGDVAGFHAGFHFRVRTTYNMRASAEVCALVTAVFMGKYRRVGSTPLAFEWQPSNVVDSIIIPILILSTCLTSMVQNLKYCLNPDENYMPNATLILALISCVPVATSFGFGVWYRWKKKDLVTNGPITLAFNNNARNLALSYEIYGALFDLVIVIVSDRAVTSALTFLIEILRTSWEVYHDVKELKASYSFGKLYLPVTAIPLLKSLNRNRSEALKSNIDLDGVVLVTGARITTEELVSRILATIEPLSIGPIGGAYWYEALGGQKRDFRYPASLGVQPTIDSIHAWMDSDEVTINFDSLGIQLASRFDLDGLCGYSANTKIIDRDGRISKASIWNDRDPNRPLQPIQVGPNPISLLHTPNPPISGHNPHSNPPPVANTTSSGIPSNGNGSGTTSTSSISNHSFPPYVSTHPPSPTPLPTPGTVQNSLQQQSSSSLGSLMDRVEQLEKILGLIGTAADTAVSVGSLLGRSIGEDSSASVDKKQKTLVKRVQVLEENFGVVAVAESGKTSLKSRLRTMELVVQTIVDLEETLGMEPNSDDPLVERLELIEAEIGFEFVDITSSLLERVEKIQEFFLE